MTAVVFGLILSPALASNQADAFKADSILADTEYTFSMRGALTAPQGDKPFGGDHVVGHYVIRATSRLRPASALRRSSSSSSFWKTRRAPT